MLVSEFEFALPPELIAQQPPAERGASRMLRLDRRTGICEDRWFAELPQMLEPGDLLVLNDSRVLPARLFATRAGLRTQAGSPAPEGLVEVLLTERVSVSGVQGENAWRALVKPAKKAPIGETLLFAARPGGDPLLRAEVVSAGEFGERTLAFAPVEGFHAVLERIGFLPLPPYIHRDRAEPNTAEDRERYQTVYSRPFGERSAAGEVGGGGECRGLSPALRFGRDDRVEVGTGETRIPSGNDRQKTNGNGNGESDGNGEKQVVRYAQDGNALSEVVAGSAAAPTAGLHFTPEILERLRARGVEIARVTLHVGLGTFQPVRVERTEEIRLHAEPYTLGAEAAEALNRAWAEGRRMVAVGTTTTRSLEHLARKFERRYGALSAGNPLRLEPHAGSTGLFLSPGPEGDNGFRLVGGLLTNFHLPQSTLLMLVSAFAGRERVLAAYAHAVRERYRFFSYGDCMLVL